MLKFCADGVFLFIKQTIKDFISSVARIRSEVLKRWFKVQYIDYTGLASKHKSQSNIHKSNIISTHLHRFSFAL